MLDLGLILSSSKSLQNRYQKYRLSLEKIMTPHKLLFEREYFIFKPCSRMKILPCSWKFKLRKNTQNMTPVWLVPRELQGNFVWTLVFHKTHYLLEIKLVCFISVIGKKYKHCLSFFSSPCKYSVVWQLSDRTQRKLFTKYSLGYKL